jgi:hypothetical protein
MRAREIAELHGRLRQHEQARRWARRALCWLRRSHGRDDVEYALGLQLMQRLPGEAEGLAAQNEFESVRLSREEISSIW